MIKNNFRIVKFFRIESKNQIRNDFVQLKFKEKSKILFILFSLFLSLKFIFIYNMKYLTSNNDIILESNDYQNFNKIKKQSKDFSSIKSLQEINIIKHIFVKKIESYKKLKNMIHVTLSVNNNKNYRYI